MRQIDTMKYDLNLLLVFDAVNRERNVTRAGERLGLSQPAVSAALGRLRSLFQDPLFVRTSQGMQPTQRAKELVEPLSRALLIIEETVQKQAQFDPAGSQRRFNIMMMDIGEMEFLPRLLQRLRVIGSGISVESTQPAMMDGHDPVAAFEAGAIDMALGYWPQLSASRGFERRRLFTDSFACVIRKDHPVIRRTISAEQFTEATHVIVTTHGNTDGVIERALLQQGLRRRIVVRVPHFLAVPEIITNTDSVVTIPAGLAARLSKIYPLRVLSPPLTLNSFDVSVYWHVRFNNDPGLRWMKETLGDLYGDSTEPSTAPRARGSDNAPRALRRTGW